MRVIRNFWISATIDGRPTRMEGGPAGKGGGVDITLKMRHEGAVVDVATIRGRAGADGSLALTFEVEPKAYEVPGLALEFGNLAALMEPEADGEAVHPGMDGFRIRGRR